MDGKDLYTRLERLGETISKTRARMKRDAHLFHDEMHLTADELKERYHILQERLRGEVAEVEAHGHHVSDLETSVRQWLDSIDEDHRASISDQGKKQ